MTPTHETATSVRYKLAEAELRRRILLDPDQQAEAIARHYAAHAMLAKDTLDMIAIKRRYDHQTPDLDMAIQTQIDAIKANHLKDFGIELEWPINPNEPNHS